ncbi:transaminase [Auriculariales sp. MPI-PUGE-AT-0066]|nr:transaminase [Auriculariales sp. MPI-PUGE-AT-0066]
MSTVLTVDSLNPHFRNVEYAVRGEIAIKAEEYRERLKQPNHGLPFDTVVTANIGNPQQKGLDQKPLTFTRQLAALLEYPPLMDQAKDLFPPDVIERARELYAEIGSIGAYSHSQGVPIIRKSVANFIQQRDGYPSDPAHIFLTAGASAGVALTISMLLNNPKSGILIPIPQYPLYTATLAQHGGVPIPYYLDERTDWATLPGDIQTSVKKALAEGIEPRALVVINPGNPTGALIEEDTMRELVKLCDKYNLTLLADEVYQDNLHQRERHPFTSFKKIVRELQSNVPLFSFHSISKGVSGECGRRGGYFECTNVPEDVLALIYKMVSVSLCPPVSGMVGVDALVRPPRPGDASYELWLQETGTIHKALAARTRQMAQRLNALPGVSCVDSPGALYLFPKLELPPKAIEAAKAAGKAPDAFYCVALLDETGICTVPGSGFGQKSGEAHYRLTCLCDGVEEYVGKLERFHKSFMAKYA